MDKLDKITPQNVGQWPKGKSLLALTAYNYPMARLLDEAGVDIIHVGDSLGVVELGFPDTTSVTMADMLRATEAVARGSKHACITADLPYRSYQTPEEAVAHSQELVEAGADAVKMEGGREILDQVKAVRAAGIEVQGHLGMLPQSVLVEGGYKRKGKTEEEAKRLKEDAMLLEEAGVFSIVLELVIGSVAEEMTRALKIPTIGIGSGGKTTGQIQVLHDVLGMCPWFVPSHAKQVFQFHEGVAGWVKKLKESF